MRKNTVNGRTFLVLREPKPVRSYAERHSCVVNRGVLTVMADRGAIVQCDCGRRYRARTSLVDDDYCVWVRRLLPWPPKQPWTERNSS